MVWLGADGRAVGRGQRLGCPGTIRLIVARMSTAVNVAGAWSPGVWDAAKRRLVVLSCIVRHILALSPDLRLRDLYSPHVVSFVAGDDLRHEVLGGRALV